MRVSKKCIDLVKEFEGCYLTSYQDAVGVWTIGYGITSSDKAITGRNIVPGMHITLNTANEWLERSLNEIYLPKVTKYSKYDFNSSQIDALVSFAYNVGSIDQLTSKGRRSIKTIEEKILEYNKAGGKTLRGLTRRRLAELQLFRSGPKTFDEGWPKLPSRGYFIKGDKGKEVLKLQKFLRWMDYDVDLDSVYDTKVENAVRKLQGLAKTTKNGKFGNKCLPFAKKYKK